MRSAQDARLRLVDGLAAPSQPEAAFAALAGLAAAEVGVRLFTVMTFDAGRGLSRRRWSSRPDAYPPGGTKPMQAGKWADQVLGRREPFVANDIEAIADHELILSLGCESCLNLPIVVDDEVLGTLNCLDAAGHYTPERAAQAREALSVPGAACLLLARRSAAGEGGHA